MNQSLFRTYRGLAIFFALLAVAACAVHLNGPKPSLSGVAILLALFGVLLALHTIALMGARQGRAWGRNLSRVLGVLLLFVIPFVTFLGAFMLMRAGKTDWQSN